jgi:hypothetical protein
LGYDQVMKNVQRRSAALALLLFLAVASTAASAFEGIDTLPWPSTGVFPAYPREGDRPTDVLVQAGVYRDNNALRVETGAQSDTITRFGVGVRQDARIIGRQRLRLQARGDYYNYNHFNGLDHFAYSLLGDWLWEIGNELSGEVLVGRDRRQIDVGETLTDRLDIATLTRVAGTAAYRISPNFRVRGGLAGTREDRNEARDREIRAASLTAAAEYVSPLANTVGLEYRSTHAKAPNAQFVTGLGFVDNDYDEREISLVATYALGAQLRSRLRLGRTTRDYGDIPQRDFQGTTGILGVDWAPGTKTILGFEAYRLPRSIIDVAASHQLIKGVAFGPRWAATNKLVLSARILRERRVFDGDPSLIAGATLRDELVTLWRFALGWEPQRFWQVGVGLDRGERESNVAGRDYQFTAVMANLAYTW